LPQSEREATVAHGLVMDVPAPIDFYDALHAEIGRRTPDGAGGLLVHVGRETSGGFQVIEIWESKELCDRFYAEIVGPALADLSGGQPPPAQPAMQGFEPRGLIIPAAHVAV
jgi:hypothetical protein